jgi:hypothetical protein
MTEHFAAAEHLDRRAEPACRCQSRHLALASAELQGTIRLHYARPRTDNANELFTILHHTQRVLLPWQCHTAKTNDFPQFLCLTRSNL